MLKLLYQFNFFLLLKHLYFLKNEIVLVCSRENLVFNLKILKFSEFFRFDILTDLYAIDFLSQVNKFELSYSLLSIEYNIRIKIKVYLSEFIAIQSIGHVFLNSNWFEREIWDLFGIFFFNSLDLRRILTDYGFSGNPLRKDFALEGYMEVKYDFEIKSLRFAKLTLLQIFSNLAYINPWFDSE